MEVVPPGTKDRPTVDEQGKPRGEIEGVVQAPTVVHGDHRGWLSEIVNPDHSFWQEPIVYAYAVEVAPGRIKGWGMHRLQADRYAVLAGTLRVVLYDGRRDSPSFQHFAEFYFCERSPGLLRIPPGVWHADQNLGEDSALLINFPTRPFDRDNPDKFRIDPGSGEIPFDFTLSNG
jgi:dTDP-4-dehydrorhamnose 3,5-epimerase